MTEDQDLSDKRSVDTKSVDTVAAPSALHYDKPQKHGQSFLHSVTIVEEEGSTQRELRLRRQVSVGRPQYPDRRSQVVGEFR